MHPLKKALPLALAVGLVAAGPAAAKSDAPSKHSTQHQAKAAGGDVPATLPSVVRVHVKRAEKALNNAGKYVDNEKPAKAIIALLHARQNMYAAWKGAVYVYNTTPPPPADSAKVRRINAHKNDATGTPTVYADPVTTVVAVLGLQHDVATTAFGLTDGAKGTLLGAASTTMFAALDRRDTAIQWIEQNQPPVEDASVHSASVHAHKAGGAVVGDFPTLMPSVATDVADEIQQIQGVTQDGAVVPTGKKILKDALVQDVLTENTINTLWPPVVDD
jgi:hypothetical protein